MFSQVCLSHKKSYIWGTEAREVIWSTIKFCMLANVHDVIMHANFGEDRFRGFVILGIFFLSLESVNPKYAQNLLCC